MPESIWSWEWTFDRASLATIASIIDGRWNIGPDRVANHAEDNMASSEPDGHEKTEENVTDCSESHVLEALR